MTLYNYKATVVRIVDGDTLDIEVDLGFNIHVDMRVRLLGVDTPEVYGVKKESEEYRKGKLASDFTARWLEAINNKVEIHTHKDKQGKYGRYLVLVLNPINADSLGEALVESGNAVKVLYD